MDREPKLEDRDNEVCGGLNQVQIPREELGNSCSNRQVYYLRSGSRDSIHKVGISDRATLEGPLTPNVLSGMNESTLDT